MRRRVWVGVCALVLGLTVSLLAADGPQFRLPKLPKKPDSIPRIDRLPSLNDLLGRAPLTSSLDDAVTAVPFLDRYNPDAAAPLLELPFGLDEGVTLVPGLWGGLIQSYCLKAGTLAPTRGDGYLWAPLKGPKAGVITSILNRSAQYPKVPQHDIQVLLWGIIARTRVSQMGEGPRVAAKALLTDAQIDSIDGSAVDVIPDDLLNRVVGPVAAPVRHALEAENRMRQAFANPGAASYDALERIAMREGLPTPEERGREVPARRWSWHTDGFYIRFMPNSYTNTRLQLYVPERFSARRDAGGRIAELSDESGAKLVVDYDPTRPSVSSAGLTAHAVRRATFTTDQGAGGTSAPRQIAASWIFTGVPGSGTPTVPGWPDAASKAESARNAWKDAAHLAGDNASRHSRAIDVADVSHLVAAIDDAEAGAFLSRAWASAVADIIGARGDAVAALDPLRHARHLSASRGAFFLPPALDTQSGSAGWGGGGGGGGFGPGGGGGMPGGGRQRLGPSLRKFGDDNSIDRARNAIDKIGMAQNALDATDPAGALGMGIPNALFGKILDFNFDKWGQAAGALAGDPPRDDFQKFTPPAAPPSDLPRLTPGAQLTRERADLLNEALVELATANAWMEAGIVAIDRHGGAVKAGERGWAAKQARALIHLKRGAGLHMIAAADRLARVAKLSEGLPSMNKNGALILPSTAWSQAADALSDLGTHFASLPAVPAPW